MGTLYLVATPIGNLEDITLRALRTLTQVGLIAAEDTRQSSKLLSHYGIKTPVTSYYEHNKLSKLERVMEALESGDVALVSDAGTPALNDPGFELVKAALERGYSVTCIPGPSAPLAALVISGMPSDAFLYLGYLPRKKNNRKHFLSTIANHPYTLVLLEAPHRLASSLVDMLELLGNRNICVVRELTKLHEEVFRGTLETTIEHFELQPARGEITLVVAGASISPTAWSEERLIAALIREIKSGQPATDLAVKLARASGWSRREVYNLIHKLQTSEKHGSSYEPG